MCKGSASTSHCHACGGAGSVRVYEAFPLFWGKRLDVWHVLHDKLIIKARKFFVLTLILLSLFGKGFLVVYIVSTLSLPATPFADIWFETVDYRIAFGWISILVDLYLFYFLTTTVEGKHRISKLKRISDENKKQVPVNIANYTTESTMSAIENAWKLADKYEQHTFLPFHLFSSLLDTPSAKILFARIGITYDDLSKKLANQFAKNKAQEKTSVTISDELRNMLVEAFIYSWQEGKEHLDETSLLFSIARHDPLVQEILYDLSIDTNKLANVVHWVDVRTKIAERYRQYRRGAHFKPKGTMDRAMTALATPMLDRYSTDLTRLAREGYLDLTIGRDDIYKRLFRIIESGRAGAVLVGSAGVGKTAILYGLAQFMTEERVPKSIRDKRLVNLDAARLVSGATASEAAERLLKIADEITRAGNIVLTLENVSSLIGISTGGEESMDIVDVLGTIVGKRQFLVIATSEPPQYGKTSTQTTLGQIFSVVQVQEPEENLAIRILESKTMVLEYKHKVFFSYDAIAELIKLSYRYLPEEFMPAKAIRLLEEIAIAKAQDDKVTEKVVRVADVAAIVSERIKIPVSKVSQKESEILLNMEQLIHKRLIDQEQAVKAVSEALRRTRAELTSSKRPIANFLFLGPTGVGKTQLAKTVAEVYFGSEENMIRLDMSEYQGTSSVKKLIGGEGASGNLTREIKKKPFSILLLDEIEKAHPDILNLFLQVMEDGRITDGTGRVIDCTHLIVIGTSNAGSQYIQDAIKKHEDVEDIKKQLLAGELRNHFSPEFLNRFDGVIVFKPLSQKDVEDIARLLLQEVTKNLEENRGVTLTIASDALAELAMEGYKPEFGARPMRRVIQDKVDTPLATLILENKIKRRDTVEYTRKGLQIRKAKEL